MLLLLSISCANFANFESGVIMYMMVSDAISDGLPLGIIYHCHYPSIPKPQGFDALVSSNS